MTEGYRGVAVVVGGETSVAVDVRLAGQVEPIDGRYHWGGRVYPHDEVVTLVRQGRRSVAVRIGNGPPRPARLGQPDPWGGVRITGVGAPPWPTDGAERTT